MQFSFFGEPPSVLPAVRARLRAAYGPQRDSVRADPIAQLVLAMVGSQTRDQVGLDAFRHLRQRYESWALLCHASPADIEAIIRPVTHADRKAAQIPRALRRIIVKSGSLDLDFLADHDEEAALQWLKALPGVGTKIAATTLNFSTLRKRTLSVDMHLLRVGIRMGLLPPNANYETGYDAFMRLVPAWWSADDLYELHWLVKRHSQEICRYGTPACGACALRDLCPRIDVVHSSAA